MAKVRERIESFKPKKDDVSSEHIEPEVSLENSEVEEDKISYDHVLSTDEIIELVNTSPDYDFLRTDPHLGEDKIALLGLGGSYAYGMAKPGSDIDIRGIALNTKEEILRGIDFEQVVDKNTDTTIYSLKKMVNLLLNNNPNTLEILGLGLFQIIYAKFEIFSEMKELEDAFLSKKVINTFGGYANSQLRRLSNKAAREQGEQEREQHILNSIHFAQEDFKTHFPSLNKAQFKLYVGDAIAEDRTYEIFLDMKNIKHVPLREYCAWVNSYQCVVREYNKNDSKRNRRAQAHEKLDKHSAHLMRLYYMCFDILENHRVITYRKNDLDILMRIRNGEFIGEDKQPTPEFFKMVDEAEDKLQKLAKTTTLPDEPDYDRVYKWLESVNERIVLGLL